MSIIPGTSIITEYDPNLDPDGRTLTLNPPTPVEYGRTVSGGIASDSVVASGAVQSVAISAAGSGYSAQSSVTITAGSGSGLKIKTTVSSGALATVEIVEAGTGYTDNEEIAVPGGTGGKITVQTNP